MTGIEKLLQLAKKHEKKHNSKQNHMSNVWFSRIRV